MSKRTNKQVADELHAVMTVCQFLVRLGGRCKHPKKFRMATCCGPLCIACDTMLAEHRCGVAS